MASATTFEKKGERNKRKEAFNNSKRRESVQTNSEWKLVHSTRFDVNNGIHIALLF